MLYKPTLKNSKS